jgi:hypothetical protein
MGNNHSRSDTIIGIMASLIAIFALGVSIWQGHEQRQHNRLSVKPALVFSIDTADDGTVIGINLKNAGTGPAIIKQFIISVDNKPVQSSPGKVWESATKILNLTDPKFNFIHYSFDPNDVVAINENIAIWSMEYENYQKLGDKEAWKQAVSRIKINVNYKSIYDEDFQVSHAPAN